MFTILWHIVLGLRASGNLPVSYVLTGNLPVTYHQLECGPMPNVMAALPNTGGALCSTLEFGYAVTLPRRETR